MSVGAWETIIPSLTGKPKKLPSSTGLPPRTRLRLPRHDVIEAACASRRRPSPPVVRWGSSVLNSLAKRQLRRFGCRYLLARWVSTTADATPLGRRPSCVGTLRATPTAARAAHRHTSGSLLGAQLGVTSVFPSTQLKVGSTRRAGAPCARSWPNLHRSSRPPRARCPARPALAGCRMRWTKARCCRRAVCLCRFDRRCSAEPGWLPGTAPKPAIRPEGRLVEPAAPVVPVLARCLGRTSSLFSNVHPVHAPQGPNLTDLVTTSVRDGGGLAWQNWRSVR